MNRKEKEEIRDKRLCWDCWDEKKCKAWKNPKLSCPKPPAVDEKPSGHIYTNVCDCCGTLFGTEDKDNTRCFWCKDDSWVTDPEEGAR